MSLEYIIQSNIFNKVSNEQLEDIFRTESIKPGASQKIFVALHNYFVTNKFDKNLISKHYYTYWKYYVWATWKNLTQIPINNLPLIIAKQFSTAFAMDIRVTDKLFYYIYSTTGDYKKANVLFRNIKDAIKEEQTLLNPTIQNNKLKISDLYIKLKGDIRMETLEQASLMAEIKRQLFSSGKTLVYLTEEDKTDIMYRYLTFYNLLLNIEDVVPVVVRYLRGLSGEMALTDVDIIMKEINNIERDKLKTKKENPVDIVKQNTVDYNTIINNIKKEFVFDSEDQTEQLEIVLSRLDELAKEKNDPAISELYYFDENSGKFKWNISN